MHHPAGMNFNGLVGLNVLLNESLDRRRQLPGTSVPGLWGVCIPPPEASYRYAPSAHGGRGLLGWLDWLFW